MFSSRTPRAVRVQVDEASQEKSSVGQAPSVGATRRSSLCVSVNSSGNREGLPGGKKHHTRVPAVPQHIKNTTGICEDAGSIPGLNQWVGDLLLLRGVV